MLKRTCTHVFKIIPINAKIREILGVPGRRRLPPFEQWMGINAHEWQRMRAPESPSCTFVYPLLGYKFNRGKAIRSADVRDLFDTRVKGKIVGYKEEVEKMDWKADYPDAALPDLYARFGLPTPPHSSCVFCPFQSSARWETTRSIEEDWATALRADEYLESVPQATRQPLFLTEDAKRLREMRPKGDGQIHFTGCDSGYCGV
jgi:hypothetical protein